MTLLRRAVGVEERMDAPDLDPVVLERCLDQIARSNRWFGARRALLSHLPALLPEGNGRVLDVGTGAADLPLAIVAWARDEGRRVRVLALDRHPQTLAVALRRTRGTPEITVGRADLRDLPHPPATFDIALCSMTLHHLDPAEARAALRELGRVARHVVVGELERSVPHYLGARLLAATLWRRNPLTRHDGPLSVRRAFTPAELRALARDAGLRAPEVHRHIFYRLVLTAHAPAP